VVTPSGVLVVTGTGTEVGKTVVTAAIAALAVAGGRSVAVLKPAQTGIRPGEPGDVDVVRELSGAGTCLELGRFPDPLAPATAARRSGLPPVTARRAYQAASLLAVNHDLVLVEGAGGLLVRFDDGGGTLADVAMALRAPVLVVAAAGLGTLNASTLTTEALRARGIECAGIVIGSWPAAPDLAALCNVAELPLVTGAPLVGMLLHGSGSLPPPQFLDRARFGLAPSLGGTLDARTVSQLAMRPPPGAAG
jgi:dethiobiotin synthetase